MSGKLKGKSAVVTGSGDGIGRGVALALAEEGAKVMVNDIGRDESGKSRADIVVEEIVKAGGKAAPNYDSVASMQGGENIIKTAVDNFGRVDILVQCAGNFKHVKSQDITEEQWDSIINVHVKGHFACAKAAIPEMIKQKGGRIINFSSRAATGGGGNPAYSTAKAGILGFTGALALDLKEFGITANAIIPSAETKLFPGKRPKAMGAGLPSPLVMDPNYVAPTVVYLATDDAQGITGRIIYAAGGDICIYAPILQVPGEPHMFMRKNGKWTVDELDVVIPSLLGLG
jgi:3-oxoacyl-[acyl-carrier protein] reductase